MFFFPPTNTSPTFRWVEEKRANPPRWSYWRRHVVSRAGNLHRWSLLLKQDAYNTTFITMYFFASLNAFFFKKVIPPTVKVLCSVVPRLTHTHTRLAARFCSPHKAKLRVNKRCIYPIKIEFFTVPEVEEPYLCCPQSQRYSAQSGSLRPF